MKDDINFLPESNKKENEGVVIKINETWKKSPWVIIAITFTLVSLALIGMIFIMDGKINDIRKEIDTLEKRNSMLEKKLLDYNEGNTKGINVDSNDLIAKLAYYTKDEYFCIDRAYLSKDMEIYLSVRLTSKYSNSYSGNGKFKFKSSDLKLRLGTLIRNINKSYNDKKDNNMPEFSDFTVKIYSDNYEIASYVKGNIKLENED